MSLSNCKLLAQALILNANVEKKIKRLSALIARKSEKNAYYIIATVLMSFFLMSYFMRNIAKKLEIIFMMLQNYVKLFWVLMGPVCISITVDRAIFYEKKRDLVMKKTNKKVLSKRFLDFHL